MKVPSGLPKNTSREIGDQRASRLRLGRLPSGQPTADAAIGVLRALWNFTAERVSDLPLNALMKRIPTHSTTVASESTNGEGATRTAKKYKQGNRRQKGFPSGEGATQTAKKYNQGNRRQKGFPSEAGEARRKTQQARANARALALAPIIAEIQAHGVTRPHAIAAALTDRGVPTALGCRFWTSCRVRDILDRLDRLGHKSASAESLPATARSVPRSLQSDNSGTILTNRGGEIITFSQARRRGRPTAREIVALILTRMRAEGGPLSLSRIGF